VFLNLLGVFQAEIAACICYGRFRHRTIIDDDIIALGIALTKILDELFGICNIFLMLVIHIAALFAQQIKMSFAFSSYAMRLPYALDALPKAIGHTIPLILMVDILCALVTSKSDEFSLEDLDNPIHVVAYVFPMQI
jgi:hypothetical protein